MQLMDCASPGMVVPEACNIISLAQCGTLLVWPCTFPPHAAISSRVVTLLWVRYLPPVLAVPCLCQCHGRTAYDTQPRLKVGARADLRLAQDGDCGRQVEAAKLATPSASRHARPRRDAPR